MSNDDTDELDMLAKAVIDLVYKQVNTNFTRLEFEIAVAQCPQTNQLLETAKEKAALKLSLRGNSRIQSNALVRGTAARLRNAVVFHYPQRVSLKTRKALTRKEKTIMIVSNTDASTSIANEMGAPQNISAETTFEAMEPMEPVQATPETAPTQTNTEFMSAVKPPVDEMGRVPHDDVVPLAGKRDQEEALMSIEELERARSVNAWAKANGTGPCIIKASAVNAKDNTMNTFAETIHVDPVITAEDAQDETSATQRIVDSTINGASAAASAVYKEAKHSVRLISNGVLLGAGSAIGLLLVRKMLTVYDNYGTASEPTAFSS